MKWFLNTLIYLSALFSLWLLEGTNWYLMFIIIVFRFNVVDALLHMKWKPGFIPRLVKSSVNYDKALIISLSFLIFISVVRMVLQSYTYIHYIHASVPPVWSGRKTSA